MPSDAGVDPNAIDLTVDLCAGLFLPSPLLAASGAMGFGEVLTDLTDYEGLGALITPSITVEARPGNPMPRTAEASAGLIHSTGLPNPGLATVLRDHLTGLKRLPCPAIANIAARSMTDWSRLAGSLADSGVFSGLELNLGWLDAATSGDLRAVPLSETALAEALQMAVRAVRGATSLPLLAKLPATGMDAGFAARIAVEAGADVVCAAQALPAVAVRLSGRSFRFPGVIGALSGPGVKPLALYHVWRIRQSVGEPILGCGGIMTAEDALEFMVTGATAVSIGVSNYVHPNGMARIASDMRAYLLQQGFASVREFQRSLPRRNAGSLRHGAPEGS